MKPLAKVQVMIGVWLIIAPFVFGYEQASAKWNDIFMGILIAMLGLLIVCDKKMH